MTYKNTVLSCVSVIALSMALAQPGLAEEPASGAAPPVQPQEADAAAVPAQEQGATAEATVAAPMAAEPPALPTEAPPTPPELPPQVAERRAEHEKMMAMTPEERWESRRAELNQRYEDLRKRAAEADMRLPETPPWDQAPPPPEMTMPDMQPPTPPEPPAWPAGMGPGRMLMSAEERRNMRETMAGMSPEERAAFRQEHYRQMRERAKGMGMDLPETPPWQRLQETAEAREGAVPPAEVDRMTRGEFSPFRGQNYQEMRERAAAQGIELPETPPWDQAPPAPPAPDWAKIKEHYASMTPAQREACEAIHRMGPLPMPPMSDDGYGPTPGYGPGYGFGQGPGYGYGQSPGYGYGPGYGQGYGRPWGYGPRRGQWPGYPE